MIEPEKNAEFCRNLNGVFIHECVLFTTEAVDDTLLYFLYFFDRDVGNSFNSTGCVAYTYKQKNLLERFCKLLVHLDSLAS